jgi:hypothetical protein
VLCKYNNEDLDDNLLFNLKKEIKMKNTILALATFMIIGKAQAIEYTQPGDSTQTSIVEIDCKGSSNGLTFNAFIWIDPATSAAKLVKLDISVSVSKWADNKAIEQYYNETKNQKGSYIGLVGEIEQGKGSYQMDLPSDYYYERSESANYKEFTTSIGLRTEFFEGSTSLKCKAMMKRIAKETVRTLKWDYKRK